MKVYLVWGDLSEMRDVDFAVVEKAFDTERKALDYAIRQYYNDDFSKGMTQAWLDDNARTYVEELVVE